MELDPNNMDPLPPDPLLKPGAFIDPHPTSNGNSVPESFSHHRGPTDPPEIRQPSDQKPGSDPPPAEMEIPGWLPPGWTVVERVRASGASAGTRDKYYLESVTKRRFRSKKEVLYYLQTGSTPLKRKKNADSDADATVSQPQANSQTLKKKKSEMNAKDMVKRFNFDDVPAKVKWELTDVYEGTWRPLLNGVDRVPESTEQEWFAAFTYLTLQNCGSLLL
ncbi:hypothetical protein Cgig2_003941 [Carnegiea gigantea]|uniref:MBD domain-containing protein n=1 Tax=Carnegiea gigantea TaxID=171969 RepID=A0A9Q1QGR9_9CARY|nr:hypothetical protein Cgig2_003941 [Carnegiea gigantea]